MLVYLVRRTLSTVPVLLAISAIVFFSMRLAPGDPVRQILGPLATEERVQETRHELGLDKPILVQYGIWLRNALGGDLGISIASHAPTTKLVGERIMKTLELAAAAFVLSLILALVSGTLSAVFQNSPLDSAMTFFALFWLSMPVFWLALMLMLLIAVKVPWIPISGRGGAIWTLDGLLHLLLPAIALGLPRGGTLTRIVRSSFLEVLLQDYITTARSKGLRERVVIMKHAFRNTLIPVITVMGLQLPWLFSGSVIVESVFAWPGMGRLLTSAVFERDYPLVQTTALFYTLVVVISNYLADIAYSFADPRIRHD